MDFARGITSDTVHNEVVWETGSCDCEIDNWFRVVEFCYVDTAPTFESALSM